MLSTRFVLLSNWDLLCNLMTVVVSRILNCFETPLENLRVSSLLERYMVGTIIYEDTHVYARMYTPHTFMHECRYVYLRMYTRLCTNVHTFMHEYAHKTSNPPRICVPEY